tara:strand:+ start:3331 stop:3540 length:210 start_codon:yes stop_codon:yes gene_type:complete
MDKDVEIQQLKEEIMSLKNLRGSEICMNADLKEYNQKLEIQIEKLIEINQDFVNKIVKLNTVIKNISNK